MIERRDFRDSSDNRSDHATLTSAFDDDDAAVAWDRDCADIILRGKIVVGLYSSNKPWNHKKPFCSIIVFNDYPCCASEALRGYQPEMKRWVDSP